MTTVARHPSVAALRRRQRAGAFNRRVGWVLLPVMVAATAVHYLPGDRSLLAGVLVALVIGLNTTHLALSIYVFGFVRPRRTLKVFHIYFGYALGVLIWVSQTNLHNEPMHTYLTILMFVGIAVHLVLGTRYAARRRAAQQVGQRYLSGG
ncbi:hypothetical protein GON03_08160 [Nocardioides sp. MAH-18]|uniref:Uncharacterized protein n=1 Tax=Nocardioides agri TaxID=2682843 RepID=A0A6L6XQY3_9ACTN|nr:MULTISPECIES: hypothetical protein [unclassified Nocardioides]MBA2954292.1 hypothetical protein [Nocardioides sp. CGMCC 1.13656]MVQ49153.1 hypothetical protein [Nocardioides sp. MAH-18]